LDQRSVKYYIDHRLVLAGNQGHVTFTRGAIKAVFSYSPPHPTRINAVPDPALLVPYCRAAFEVTRDIIQRGIDDVQGKSTEKDVTRAFLSRKLAPAAAVMLMAVLVVNIGGWDLTYRLSDFLSTAENVATVQGQAFIRKPVSFAESTPTPPETAQKQETKTKESKVDWILDKQTSLGKLLTFFDVESAQNDGSTDNEVYPNLYTYRGDPSLFKTFEKPFLIRVQAPDTEEAGYLLIESVTQGGAIAIDEAGSRRPVTEDFILKHWDGEMSWVYPYEQMDRQLAEGMTGLGVLRVQQQLQALGYKVEPRGVYDSITSEEVTRFQLNYGLKPSGKIGTATRALIYQMRATG